MIVMTDNNTILDYYIKKQISRFEWLSDFSEKSLPILDNRLLINGKLSATGIGNLGISKPIEVTSLDFIPDPTNESHVGRFAYGFQMNEGYRDDNSRIPMGLKGALQIRDNGILGVDLEKFKDHRARPAYYRALALWPGFFVNLTIDISATEQPPSGYGPEIYLAYRIMSKLIDYRDLGVVNSEGEIDTKYLFRRSFNFPDLNLAEAN